MLHSLSLFLSLLRRKSLFLSLMVESLNVPLSFQKESKGRMATSGPGTSAGFPFTAASSACNLWLSGTFHLLNKCCNGLSPSRKVVKLCSNPTHLFWNICAPPCGYLVFSCLQPIQHLLWVSINGTDASLAQLFICSGIHIVFFSCSNVVNVLQN